MSKLLRYFEPGQTCLITSKTAYNQQILHRHPSMLRQAFKRAARGSTIEVIAWVILPDHIHTVLFSPTGDFSTAVQRFKLSFALQWKRIYPGGYAVWQNRYYDRVARSQEQLNRFIDYVHFNPVHHGWVKSPRYWGMSSYRKYLGRGYYGADWGESEITFGDESFGE